MRIINSNAEIDPSELDGLTELERSALQSVADKTNITIAEYFQGVITDRITSAVRDYLDSKAALEKPVIDAFVQADKATQDEVKELLGIAVAPGTIDAILF